jgi:hypothetical protein
MISDFKANYQFRKLVNGIVAFLFTIVFSVLAQSAFAQTKGLIVKPATGSGKLVLDPDGDGYLSNKTAGVQRGFQTNDTTESEISYKPFPLPGKEPMEDLARGPKQGFSDFADVPGSKVYPVSSYLSPAGNFMFRFRLGGIAPNSKGYSILVDADGLFGYSGVNADPQASADNPGFEFEILLATNFAVRLYDVNNSAGTATQVGTDADLPYATYAQKGIAYFENSGSDYFYDFYMPFSKITTYFNGSTSLKPLVNTSTPLRMVANTIMAPQSVIKGPISDISGIDDRNYASPAAAWEKLVNGFVAKAPDGTTTTYYQAYRSDAPVITSSSLIAGIGKTITGTSSEAVGTIIKIYKGGVYLGQTTVVTGGTWTYPASGTITLAVNERYTATATATGESESVVSNEVIVQSSCTYSITPTMTCASDKGFAGKVSGAARGTVVNIYKIGDPTTVVVSITTGNTAVTGLSAADEFAYSCSGNYGNSINSCNPGQGCVGSSIGIGSYYARAVETGKCESARSNSMCVSGNGNNNSNNSAAPTLATSPVTQSTTSISGTGVAGARVIVLADNIYLGAYDIPTGQTNYTFSGLTVRTGQTLQVQQVETGKCASAYITQLVVNPGNPPVVTDPIRTSATSISGTSTEASGTVITVYKDGASIGTSTVTSTETWTLISVSGLAAGDIITATATATNETASALSNAVTVTAVPAATPSVPTVTLIGSVAYKEGGTTVNVTVPANTPTNTKINLYIDGYLLRTISTTSTSTSAAVWQVTGLSATEYELYTGGYLTATLGTIGSNESAQSNNTSGNYIIVECVPPTVKTATRIYDQVCTGSTAEFDLAGSQSGVIYTLMNGTTERGPSILGTGDASPAYVAIISFPLTNTTTSQATETFSIVAKSVTGGSCTSVNMTVSPSGIVTINPAPLTDRIISAPASVPTNNTAEIIVKSTQSGLTYQLRKGTTIIGSAQNGNSGNLTFTTDNISQETTYNIYVTDKTKTTYCTAQLTQTAKIGVSNTPLPVELFSFTGKLERNAVLLEWATASEKNNDHFQVERSLNGKEFETIGKVQGHLNSNTLLNYSFLDHRTPASIVYYRLKQVDLDGTFEYSKIIAIERKNLSGQEQPIIYPNPTNSNCSIILNSQSTETAKLIIYDAIGNALRTESVNLNEGQTIFEVQTKELRSGLYLIKVLGQTVQTNFKLRKLNN